MFTAQRRFDHLSTVTDETIKVTLKVVDTPSFPSLSALGEGRLTKHAYVNPEEEGLKALFSAGAVSVLLRVHEHGQIVYTTIPCPDIPRGSIALTDIQRVNCHVCLHGINDFYVTPRPTTDEAQLTDITLEARPLDLDFDGIAHVDASGLRKRLAKLLFDHMVTMNEQYVLHSVPTSDGHDVDVICRVVDVNVSLSEEDEVLVSSHDITCGIAAATTTVFVLPEESSQVNTVIADAGHSDGEDDSEERESKGVFELANVVRREKGSLPTNTVIVHTNDEEWFPVKKKLLVPCITVTKHVRDKSTTTPEVSIDVDCLTFDRVIIYLEHEYKGTVDEFDFDLHLTEPMLDAAKSLGCRGLEELCQRKLGDYQSRIREHAWDDVMSHNGRGGVWLCIDGMLFDVERWLDEHPGGNKIIPNQALGVDATVFFELYHSSRESFQYLKQFYIGEVREADKDKIPFPDKEKAHPDFYAQLRDYTTWRLKPKEAVFKSF